MNCWDVLGIDPTRDRHAIEQAFAQQEKFASGAEMEELEQAYGQALAEAGIESPRRQPSEREPLPASVPEANNGISGEDRAAGTSLELGSREHQIARETVLQVRALLNDSQRSRDLNIWRAILTEPPADQPGIRNAIGESLDRELRPMAENGSFPPDVTLFLGDWFGWQGVSREAGRLAEEESAGVSEESDAREEDLPPGKPQMVNFWPAILGWIVGLIILTSLFSGMGGGG
ncbi:J domain-containing protein [Marinobacter sp.]|uniref:J domain-containing protein n=1 Tax=Marinobacter sp. TaxID=50741 RepID=UPI00384FA2E5